MTAKNSNPCTTSIKDGAIPNPAIGGSVGKRWLHSLKSDWIHKGVMLGIVASGVFYLYEALG